MKKMNKKLTFHPLVVRWTHWINFPILTMMVWSGLLIYWANRTYWPVIPDSFYTFLNLDHHLAEGMSYHFFFMWIFAINGLAYFLYILFTGYWKEIAPKKDTFKQAFRVVLHDLGFKIKLPDEKFNAAQRLAYSGIIVMGFGSLLTGLAIYKPIQLNWLKNLLGGYELARHIHFYLTVGFVVFFLIHIAQVMRAGFRKFCLMVGERKSFAALFLWIFIFIGGFSWIKSQSDINMAPVTLRHVLEFNESLWVKILNPNKVDTFRTKAPPQLKSPRFNGNLGLETPLHAQNWTIEVATPMTSRAPFNKFISLDEIKKLPRTDILNEFKCIEGWSEVTSFSGVKFVDFLNHYHLGTHSGNAVDYQNNPQDLFAYVGLETPDGEYYVSIDMKSMLSPQTLLAFEQNGLPLGIKNGAPIRLAIPNKYGVKNIKRIKRIVFADSKLPDYWGEEGYDWFIGL